MIATLLAIQFAVAQRPAANACPAGFEAAFLAGSAIGGLGGECGMTATSVNPEIAGLGDSILPCLDS
ncbi:MAG TPA: hypothetical protein VFO11_13820, partial [Candidatus Polarisedimenticolaceae bacterium]|nr:hypothetical protein [Candidatus Polarisedimenticolaceae bacterium]